MLVANAIAPALRAGATYDSTVLGDSPSYFWKLLEASGTSAADSAGTNTGTYTGGFTLNQTGIGDGEAAVLLNGSTGWVESGTSLSSPAVFSLEIWFKTTATAIGGLLGFSTSQTSAGAQPTDRLLYVDATGHVGFSADGSSPGQIVTTGTFNDGNWHHAVATVTNSPSQSNKLYVDGSLIGSSATTNSSYTGFWQIGVVRQSGGVQFFNGTIAKAAIYPAVLTSTQVSNHFNARTGSMVLAPSGLYVPQSVARAAVM